MDVYGQGAAAGTAFQLADAATWLVPLIFALVVGAFIFSAVKNVSEWLSNNKKPVETEKAKVVTKREHVRRRASGNRSRGGGFSVGPSRYQTAYYVTFELESGDRREFKMRGNQYAKLAEGDVGHLTYQGTRYHEFERVA
ncbi:DUF2500 domain-containing protein [Salipaludibacillus sp. CUR1]|uniref:DUF2500 domain-containing protein n=1 Tax=Salipaludibacillus sp. CUR1 TaxID=2820003 RepID=UPI001E4C395B|nr:DUF2500 domain-containing protein [Salipaludibacillus sp. CUR1]MCE7792877.1 DUF2500 domain-containing protein [Salipaludibacillus sp. CUR1]